MNVNPMQLIQLMKNGMNPQQLVMGILQNNNNNNNNNPILQNAINLAQNGNIVELENLARNLAVQRGMDFDKEFANFKSQLPYN